MYHIRFISTDQSKMIANITAIVYINSISDDDSYVQKGSAISRTDDENGFQVYQFTSYLPNQDNSPNTNDDSGDFDIVQPFKEGSVYQISGKFGLLKDELLEIVITTSLQLNIDKDEIPISKPIANFVGRILSNPDTIAQHYTLSLQVKPYLSKDRFTSFSVILIHPENGRLRNAFAKAKKNSVVYSTGILIFQEHKVYCEVLEFQFISVKAENEHSIVVPWKVTKKVKNNQDESIETEQNLSMELPSSSMNKSKDKGKMKMSEISKSLISKNKEDDQFISAESKDDKITESDKYNETSIVRKKHETRSNLAKRQRISK